MMLRLPRHCSASNMFAQAHVDGFHAIMRKKAVSMLTRLRGSPNTILKCIASRWDCPFQRRWVGIAGGKIPI